MEQRYRRHHFPPEATGSAAWLYHALPGDSESGVRCLLTPLIVCVFLLSVVSSTIVAAEAPSEPFELPEAKAGQPYSISLPRFLALQGIGLAIGERAIAESSLEHAQFQWFLEGSSARGLTLSRDGVLRGKLDPERSSLLKSKPYADLRVRLTHPYGTDAPISFRIPVVRPPIRWFKKVDPSQSEPKPQINLFFRGGSWSQSPPAGKGADCKKLAGSTKDDPLGGATFSQLEKCYLEELRTQILGKDNKVKTLLDEIKKFDDTATGMTGEIAFGFNGDGTNRKSVFKTNVESKITVGGYPGEARFQSGAKIEFEEGKLEEDVTRSLANFDYYFSPRWEVFGFLERFSDNFLGIDERYEVGAGFEWEWNSSAQYESAYERIYKEAEEANRKAKAKRNSKNKDTNKKKRPARGFNKFKWDQCMKAYTSDGCKPMKKLHDAIENVKTSPSTIGKVAGKETFEHVFEDALEALRKKHSRWEVGLALSAFAEYEKFENIETEIKIPEASMMTLLPDAEQRFRLSLRPSATYRPSQNVRIRNQPVLQASDR